MPPHTNYITQYTNIYEYEKVETRHISFTIKSSKIITSKTKK